MHRHNGGALHRGARAQPRQGQGARLYVGATRTARAAAARRNGGSEECGGSEGRGSLGSACRCRYRALARPRPGASARAAASGCSKACTCGGRASASTSALLAQTPRGNTMRPCARRSTLSRRSWWRASPRTRVRGCGPRRCGGGREAAMMLRGSVGGEREQVSCSRARRRAALVIASGA